MAEFTDLRNNALPYPIYGLPFTIGAPVLDADGDLVSGPTSLDSEISKNGDTFTDCTNEAVEIATSSGMVYLELTGTELTTNMAAVKIASGNGKTTPIILYPRILPVERSNTAQAGAASTITLDASASAQDRFFCGCVIHTTGGTGSGQVRMITGYVGSTKVATVTPAWDTTPDNTTTWDIYVPETANAQVKGLATLADINAELDSALGDYDGPTKAEMDSKIDALNNFDSTSDQVIVATNNDKTDYALTASERTSIADTIFKRDLSAITGEAARSLLNAIRALRNRVGLSGGTYTVYKEDDTTPAWTGTATTASGADPVSEIDPT